MNLPDSNPLTSEQVSLDVRQVANKRFSMSVPEFIRAVDTGTLCSNDYAVRELLAWIEVLPDTDPAFSEINKQCLASAT